MAKLKPLVLLLNLVAFAWLTSGCSGIAVPEGKMNYVGEWRGLGTTLTITPDGGVSFHRVSGSWKTEINAPLQAFLGDNFEVGVSFLTTTFVVSKPPEQIEGVWKMTVDGVELTRVDDVGG